MTTGLGAAPPPDDAPPPPTAPGDDADPLPEAAQRRGRRFALLTHPFAMTYRLAITGDLATQALVTLGALDAAIGAQAALTSFSTLVQLPALQLIDRWGKRRLLLVMQVLGLVAALPLLAFASLRALGPALAVPLALASLGLTTAALTAGSTAWWPLLHGFVPHERAGRFFSVLRTLWSASLVAFYLTSVAWLHDHPGGFGALFGLAWGCGLLRAVLLLGFPERREPSRLRLRDALRRFTAPGPLRKHLTGVGLDTVVMRAAPAFAIVLLRKGFDLGPADTFWTTVALFLGGALTLYPAGRLVDRLGARPVLLLTCLLRGGLVLGLALAALLPDPRAVLWTVVALLFAYSVLSAAFGLAEVKLLFELAPGAAPSAIIVASVVGRNLLAGVFPLVAGGVLDALIGAGAARIPLYQGLFVALGVCQACAGLPFLRPLAPPPP